MIFVECIDMILMEIDFVCASNVWRSDWYQHSMNNKRFDLSWLLKYVMFDWFEMIIQVNVRNEWKL